MKNRPKREYCFKKIRWKPTFLWVVVFVVSFPAFLFAEGDPFGPSMGNLENSLRSLKNSLDELQEKNNVLKSENDSLRQKINDLERRAAGGYQQRMAKKRSSSGDKFNRNKEIFFSTKELERYSNDLDDLNVDLRNIEEQMQTERRRIKEIENGPYSLKEDQSVEESRIQAAPKNYEEESRSYQAPGSSPAALDNRIRLLQEKQDQLTAKYRKPKAVLGELESKQRSLKQGLSQLQKDYGDLNEQARKVRNSKQAAAGESVLNDPEKAMEIHDLKKRSQELEQLLTVARKKLGQAKLELNGAHEGDREELSKNLEVLKKENSDLKARISILEKTDN